MALEKLLRRSRWIVPALALALAGGPLACKTEAARPHKKSAAAAKKPSGPRWASIGRPNLGYTTVEADHNFQGVHLADRDSTLGRIQRTERWRNIIEAVEDKYDIPRNIIYAVIMQESYGDPIQPNATNDGGLGLVHFQPGTARAYGLRIFGNSNAAGADHPHGRRLRDLLEDCERDVPCVLREDDRAHPVINVDAIARYLKDGYDRKGTWWGAVGTINPGQGSYARRIWRWKGLIDGNRRGAAQDFNRRNRGKTDGTGHSLTWDHYVDTFRRANEHNYDLDDYRGMSRRPR